MVWEIKNFIEDIRIMNNNKLYFKTNQRWFITGATGFIGREFVRNLLDSGIDASNISVLVRSGRALSSREKLENSLKDIVNSNALANLKIIDGDITQDKLGLDLNSWQQLAKSTHIIHLAALTNFDADLEQARLVNVHGVKNIIELAQAAKKNGTLKHWSHVSTAYVAGSRTDKVHPGELNFGDHFRNSYEQSKNEAERLLQPFLLDFPLTIFRPSIVIGNSKTGEAGNFNTVYWAIRNYLSGHNKVYAKANAALDLVPVDYVVNAMFKIISDTNANGKTVLLAGGDKTTVSLYEFANSICRYMDSPLPEIIDPAKLRRMRLILAISKLSKRHRKFISQAESYLPYFTQNPRFETSETESLLEQSNITVPYLDDYIGNILDYCLNQSWGRRSKMVGLGYTSKKVANG